MRGGLIAARRKVMADWESFLSGEDQQTGAPGDSTNVVPFGKRA